MQQVEDAIARSNANVGGDILTLGTQSHNVRAVGLLGGGVDPLDPANVEPGRATIETDKLDDIRNVVVATSPDGHADLRPAGRPGRSSGTGPRLGIVGRGDEDDVVEGIVLMRKYEKSLPTADGRRRRRWRRSSEEELLPKGMQIEVFNQRTDLVHVTTHNVLHNLVVGIGLVDRRPLRLPGRPGQRGDRRAGHPAGPAVRDHGALLQGKSANLLSIGAVDFGIIVDSSVIIVETIYRHITAHGADRTRPLIDRIADASHGVERPIFFSTMIIVCAFLPLFTMTRAGRGPVRADGHHLRLLDPRGAADLRDAGPGPLLVPLPQQDGGEGDAGRPGDEGVYARPAHAGRWSTALVARC